MGIINKHLSESKPHHLSVTREFDVEQVDEGQIANVKR